MQRLFAPGIWGNVLTELWPEDRLPRLAGELWHPRALGDVIYKVVKCGKLSLFFSCGFLRLRSFSFPLLYYLISTNIRAGRDL
jgi:hypothetical protein